MRHTLEIFLLLTRRDVGARYKGAVLGIGWAVLLPFIMLAVFTFVFGVVIPVKWPASGGTQAGSLHFAVSLFSGLVVYNFFAEALARAPTLVTGKANFVKKIIFPLHILPWVAVMSAGVNLAIGLAILILAQLFLPGGLALTLFGVPLLLVPLALVVTGIVYTAAAWGVFNRDLGQLVGPVIQLMMFLSPVFYPLGALNPTVAQWLSLNPLTFYIESLRGLLFTKEWFDPLSWAIQLAISVVIFWLGFRYFQRRRKEFADVL